MRSEPSYTFVDDTVAVDGIAILLFCGPLAYSFGVDTGWRPVGPQGTVTRSTSTEISEIDGRPAIEFYQHYLGAGEAAAANPLAVSQEGSSGFYLRAPVGFDEDRGSVLVFGDVPEGAHVQLSIAGLDDLLGGTKAAIGRALEAYPSTAPPPSAGLLFSCVIRKVLLGTRTGREVEMVRDILGPDVPIAGLYCYGEIAPTGVDEVSRFHNETMVAVLLGSA